MSKPWLEDDQWQAIGAHLRDLSLSLGAYLRSGAAAHEAIRKRNEVDTAITEVRLANEDRNMLLNERAVTASEHVADSTLQLRGLLETMLIIRTKVEAIERALLEDEPGA